MFDQLDPNKRSFLIKIKYMKIKVLQQEDIKHPIYIVRYRFESIQEFQLINFCWNMASKRSPVWSYFVCNSAGKAAKCLQCNKLVIANNNTTNLRNHLKVHHHHIFLKLQKKSRSSSPISEESRYVVCIYLVYRCSQWKLLIILPN